jgi:ketosteroid isomerase-like protein
VRQVTLASVSSAEQLVRGLYERYQQRDWAGAAHLMHPAAQLDMPATGEHLVGRDQIIGLQENYPEPWGDLAVLRVVSEDSKHLAVAEFEIVSAAGVFRCAAFWRTHQEKLHRGVEYWVTVGGEQPPAR